MVEWKNTASDKQKENEKPLEVFYQDDGRRFQILAATSKKEAWERFVNLYAQFEFEQLQIDFVDTYGINNLRTIKDKLKEIKKFIKDANKGTTIVAYEKTSLGIPKFQDNENEYLRLTERYYEKNKIEEGYYTNAAIVYGKYFLFKEWLESELKNFEASPIPDKPDFRIINSIEEMGNFFSIIINDYLQYTIFEKEGRNPNIKEPTPEYFEKVINKTVHTGHIKEIVSREFETRPLHYTEVINKLYEHASYLINKLKPYQKKPENWNKWDQIAMQLMGIAKSYKELADTRNAALNKTFAPPTETPEVKPVFISEIIDQVYNLLKDFFSKEQQPQLKLLLETGNDATPKLLFNGNANQLTDTFQKLYDSKFIVGCQKETLQHWIVNNFSYTGKKNSTNDFEYETVRKGISTYTNPCMSPILKIDDGKIIAIKQEQKKKYKKY